MRIRIAGPDGRVYARSSRVAGFRWGGTRRGWRPRRVGRERFHIDGGCEIPLPSGVRSFQARAGICALNQTLRSAGAMAVRLTISRRATCGRGWYSGDTRCHFLSPHTANLEATGEPNIVQLR